MKTFKKQKIKTICEKELSALETAFNEAMDTLMIHNPTASPIASSEHGFWCVIYYEVEESFIENAEDVFYMKGERYTCMDCPLREQPQNKTVMRVRCDHSPSGTCHLKYGACETFYRRLLDGTIEPVGGKK